MIPSTGDKVRVTGYGGSVLATVERCCTPADLPELPAQFFGLAEFAAGALDSLDVDHVALLSYQPKDQSHEPWIFAAVHAHGKWADLQGQLIEIEPARIN